MNRALFGGNLVGHQAVLWVGTVPQIVPRGPLNGSKWEVGHGENSLKSQSKRRKSEVLSPFEKSLWFRNGVEQITGKNAFDTLWG